MNELQQYLLKITKDYISVCNQLGLTYFAHAGTALGAVRHNGFIPWDDDVDFVMPRKDYEIFLKKAPSLLPDYYFIQNHKTEKKYIFSFSKLRDSRTTCIEGGYAQKLNYNHGVFIDIFPLDSLPSNLSIREKYDKIKQTFVMRTFGFTFFEKTIKGYVKKILLFIRHPSKRLFFLRTERPRLKYTNGDCSECWTGVRYMKTKLIKKEWFEKSKFFKFEDIMVPVPYKYQEYLTSIYGNWKLLPKESERVGHHGIIVDLNKPYTDYRDYYGRKFRN